MFRYFYHASIRKLVVAFGSLFDEIYISRTDSTGAELKKIKVPISYGPKEKFYRKINELENTGAREAVENILPRIGFEITGMNYDTGRKLNSLNKSFVSKSQTGTTFAYSYSEVPYNFDFDLNIMTRNIDDGYQILEQILPFFTPDFTITMNFTEIDRGVDVPFVLNGVRSTEDYEGDLETRRLVTHTLSFQAKSYIFSPINRASLIRESTINFYNLIGVT